MSVKLLTEHLMEYLSFIGGYTGSSESTLVKMSCWKSHVMAQNSLFDSAHSYDCIYHMVLMVCKQFSVNLYDNFNMNKFPWSNFTEENLD